MVVSWYVPTVRRFADPSKHARLYYILQPLFTEQLTWTTRQQYFSKILRTTQKWAQRKNVVSGVHPYQIYHAELAKELPKLKGKKIIFIPGITIDQADHNPKYIGVDYACERNRLTEKILFAVQDLHKKYGWDMFDDVHFIAVAPVILPFHITPEGTLVHSLDEAVERTNKQLSDERILGNTTRNPLSEEFQQGIMQYNVSLIDSQAAKEAHGKTILGQVRKYKKKLPLEEEKLENLVRLFGTKRELRTVTKDDVDNLLEKDVSFNKQLLASAYARVAELSGLDALVCYMAKGSPEISIMKSVQKIAGIPVDSFGSGVMRNAGRSVLKEADERAISLLKGRLYTWFVEKIGKDPKQRMTLPRIKEEEPSYNLPQPCPKLSCFRCPYAGLKKEDIANAANPAHTPQVKNCACDFVEGKFTKEDVLAVLKEKYGNKLLVDPQKLCEEFMLFQKKIKFLEEDGSVHEATGLDILLQDVRGQGWTFTWIPEDFRLMQVVDGFIARIGRRGEYKTRSWKRFLGDGKLIERLQLDTMRGEILPLIVPASAPDHYSIRPSEFSSQCPIGRILAKIDPAKLPEEIIPHKWSVSGTLRHLLGLWRPWVDYMGKAKIPIWEFTERELWTSFPNPSPSKGELDQIFVFGHADGLGQIVDDHRVIPLVLDYKRSPNEKPSYSIQEMLYLRGINRALDAAFDNGVLVLVNRPHFADPEERKFPVYHYTYADSLSEHVVQFRDVDILDEDVLEKDDENTVEEKIVTITGLHELVVRDYKLQHALVSSRDAYLRMQKKCCATVCANTENPGECGHQFNRQLCTVVKRLVQQGEDIQKYFYDGVVI